MLPKKQSLGVGEETQPELETDYALRQTYWVDPHETCFGFGQKGPDISSFT